MSPTRGAPDAPLVLACGDGARARWGADLEAIGDVIGAGERPGRDEVDPLLGRAGRLVVAGSDAALAAVLVRLLRRERLDVPVALLPAPGSVAAAVWGVPTGPGLAVALASHGSPRACPLVRDDRGGVVAGAHGVGPFRGAVYCDEHRLLHGEAAGLEVRPDPEAHGVDVTVTGHRRLGGLRAGTVSRRSGRAVQVGCRPASATRDGLADDRPVERRSWYRHLEDWWLVRP